MPMHAMSVLLCDLVVSYCYCIETIDLTSLDDNALLRHTCYNLADKPRDASASVALSCNREFAAIRVLRYISETVQARSNVTIECEDVSETQTVSPLAKPSIFGPGFKVTVIFKDKCLKTVHFISSNCNSFT